jgi:hypothetical protein
MVPYLDVSERSVLLVLDDDVLGDQAVLFNLVSTLRNFFFVANDVDKVLVPAKTFQTSLTNIRLGWKGLSGTNTLAYLENP